MVENNDLLTVDQRNYGIDILRFLSMFFVVIIHVLGFGGVLSSTEFMSAQYNILLLVEAVAMCGVDCFVLISGYVACTKRPKYANIVTLWLQVLFYSAGITILFFLLGEDIGLKSLIMSFFPVASQQYWFFTAYFGMFLITPFLNIVIQKTDIGTLKWGLVILSGLYIILNYMNSIFTGGSDLFGLNAGYSVIWFIVLYLIGGYIRRTDFLIKTHINKVLAIACGSIFITWGSRIIIEFLTYRFLGNAKSGGGNQIYFTNHLAVCDLFTGVVFKA